MVTESSPVCRKIKCNQRIASSRMAGFQSNDPTQTKFPIFIGIFAQCSISTLRRSVCAVMHQHADGAEDDPNVALQRPAIAVFKVRFEAV